MRKKQILSIFACIISFSLFNTLQANNQPYTLHTPNGSIVNAMTITDYLSPDDIYQIHLYYEIYFPQAVRIGSASNQYNCHSYA